jgi:BirA family biotin operon repressor/biotin-[acetyl-CoA-carboxylase] ligase
MQLRIERHGLVDSTSERAFDAIARGRARHGDVHVASAQSAGRGRRGARWFSPAGEGLYLSAVLLPRAADFRPEAVSIAGALAVRAALEGLGQPGLARLELKWPNDLLVTGAKLSGVLVESRGLDPARPHAVLGIGVNVAQRSFPPELEAERPVTSLALLGVAITPEELLGRLLAPLALRLELCESDAERLAAEYLAASGLAGADVVARTADGERRGRLVGLSLARGLTLAQAGGREQSLALGHVQGLAPAGKPAASSVYSSPPPAGDPA